MVSWEPFVTTTKVQLEARVLGALDAVTAGRRIEDSLLELKSDWPEPGAAARRIAGHANAARGEDVLWIIGLDERSGVNRIVPTDLATWWPQVRSHFNITAPALMDHVVQTPDGPLEALLFDTSLSPFLVRNPVYGTNGGGPVSLEVPWREGTSVRTAGRADLIRLLVPMQKLPALEILSASADLIERQPSVASGADDAGSPWLEWFASIEMYIVPAVGTVAVLPVHQTRIDVSPVGRKVVELGGLQYSEPSATHWGNPGFERTPDSVSVQTTRSEAIVHLPGRVHCRGTAKVPGLEVPQTPEVLLRFAVRPTHSEHSIQMEVSLTPAAVQKGVLARWAFGEG